MALSAGGAEKGASLVERLEGINGVSKVEIRTPFEGADDLEIDFVGRPDDAVSVHHVKGGSLARVFFRTVRIEEMPMEWLVEFVERIADGQFTVRRTWVQTSIAGKLRELG